ncbi:putative PB1 domain-containing protein [Helianthus annuus]|nr:putative PB1 domain-containing protein [Helianthus annuus]
MPEEYRLHHQKSRNLNLNLHFSLYISHTPSNLTHFFITGTHDDSVSGSSRPESAPERVKFLCSHGGKILPRPADGRLKYTGGDTRVISVHRHITFHDLMKKVTSMFKGEMILKYQLMPEDFETLVTVKSDEDVRHMIDEFARHGHVGGPRLRAFLFPANPIVTVNHSGSIDRHSLEQRYINSINGIVVQPPPVRPRPVNTSYTTFSNSSACSSPRSPPPETMTTTATNPESTTCHGRSSSLTRTRSSPSLNNQVATVSPNLSQNRRHHHRQQPPHHFHHQPYHPPKPPLDRHPHKTGGPEHLGRMKSTGVAEYYRQQPDHTKSHSHGTNRGGQMYDQRGSPYDAYYDGDCRYDRTDSPPSPDASSSSHSMRSER